MNVLKKACLDIERREMESKSESSREFVLRFDRNLIDWMLNIDTLT